MPRNRPNEAENEIPRDALVPHFGTSQFAQDILQKLQDEGCVLLKSVISEEEADVELDRAWDFIEKVSPGVSRHRPRTWWPSESAGRDPWPHAQRDMFQLHQAGWLFGELREKIAERVFERVYGTRELHCSKDGFTFHRPTSRESSVRPGNDHFDQGFRLSGLQCVQGSVALTHQEDGDGCFLCWPGSHRARETVMASSNPARRGDFIMLSAEQRDTLRRLGYEPRRIPVNKGDVLLWRSDLCHCGAPPIGARPGFRAVVYICCMPAALTLETAYESKRQAYEQLQTGSHWPNQEEWFKPRDKHLAMGFKPYFSQPPPLSQRQQELYGLVRYCTEESQGAAPINDSFGHASVAATGIKKPARNRRWGTRASQSKNKNDD